MYIPLIFWFNNHSKQALPLIAMEYTDIKLNYKVNTIDNIFKNPEIITKYNINISLYLDYINLDDNEREKFNLSPVFRSSKFYSIWENAEPEFRKIINSELFDKVTGELVKPKGVFPSHPILIQSGLSWLSVLAIRYHGGLNGVRTKLDYPTSHDSSGSFNQAVREALAKSEVKGRSKVEKTVISEPLIHLTN